MPTTDHQIHPVCLTTDHPNLRRIADSEPAKVEDYTVERGWHHVWSPLTERDIEALS